jgi:hypothetical protein
MSTLTLPAHDRVFLALEGAAAELAQPGVLLAACVERARDPEADQLGLRRSRLVRVSEPAAR